MPFLFLPPSQAEEDYTEENELMEARDSLMGYHANGGSRCWGMRPDPGPCRVCKQRTGDENMGWRITVRLAGMEQERLAEAASARQTGDFRPQFDSARPGDRITPLPF